MYQYKNKEPGISGLQSRQVRTKPKVVPFPITPDSQAADGNIEEAMKERLQRFLNHQIPAAEGEADELAGLAEDARTPQEVKSRLGEAMGADFSGVRFHTQDAAVRQAEDIGARAYTAAKMCFLEKAGLIPALPRMSWYIRRSRVWYKAACQRLRHPRAVYRWCPSGLKR